METSAKKFVKRKARKNQNNVPAVIAVKTANGNVVSMRSVPEEEIKALRNPTYPYLA